MKKNELKPETERKTVPPEKLLEYTKILSEMVNCKTVFTENGENKYISRERVSAVRRSFYVGDIDQDKITAKYENGVLTVELPKKDPVIESAKKITIE